MESGMKFKNAPIDSRLSARAGIVIFATTQKDIYHSIHVEVCQLGYERVVGFCASKGRDIVDTITAVVLPKVNREGIKDLKFFNVLYAEDGNCFLDGFVYRHPIN